MSVVGLAALRQRLIALLNAAMNVVGLAALRQRLIAMPNAKDMHMYAHRVT